MKEAAKSGFFVPGRVGVASGSFALGDRDLSQFFGNWSALQRIA